MNGTSSFAIHQPCFQLPVLSGIIERRILVNFRCKAAVLAQLLPPPFRAKLVNGWGMAGICLIRLGGIHPAFLPALCGLKSENAAHRIAVEWDEDGATREGVFVPRRDTNALLNRLVGGKIFPGIHHAANFEVNETENHFKLEMQSEDGETFVRVSARVADEFAGRIGFQFASRSVGVFSRRRAGMVCASAQADNEFDGLELQCREWRMESLAVEKVESSFFENAEFFSARSRQNLTARFLCVASRTNGTHARGSPFLKIQFYETTHHSRGRQRISWRRAGENIHCAWVKSLC